MNLRDISWPVSEREYREDPALSYSTLARYNREGFNGLDHLGDELSTPSLTFGSAVDSLITGGQKEFDERFLVADIPNLTDSVIKMVTTLFEENNVTYHKLVDIPSETIIEVSERLSYQKNWKPETRVKVIKEQGSEYYTLLYSAQNKQIISSSLKEEIDATVRALKESPNTKFYFAQDNPFDGIERFYQLKFKATLSGVDYRCMADLIIVDNNNKVIRPVDLKTSSHAEWDFYQSFVTWNYAIQARLYWRLIRETLNRYPQFQDYKLLDYVFIVVNKKTLVPLVWEFKDTQTYGTLVYGKNKNIVCRDPFDLGGELRQYLHDRPKVPNKILLNSRNDIVEWLNKEL